MLTTGADRLVTVDKTSPWYAGHGADPPALVGEENYGETTNDRILSQLFFFCSYAGSPSNVSNVSPAPGVFPRISF